MFAAQICSTLFSRDEVDESERHPWWTLTTSWLWDPGIGQYFGSFCVRRQWRPLVAWPPLPSPRPRWRLNPCLPPQDPATVLRPPLRPPRGQRRLLWLRPPPSRWLRQLLCLHRPLLQPSPRPPRRRPSLRRRVPLPRSPPRDPATAPWPRRSEQARGTLNLDLTLTSSSPYPYPYPNACVPLQPVAHTTACICQGQRVLRRRFAETLTLTRTIAQSG